MAVQENSPLPSTPASVQLEPSQNDTVDQVIPHDAVNGASSSAQTTADATSALKHSVLSKLPLHNGRLLRKRHRDVSLNEEDDMVAARVLERCVSIAEGFFQLAEITCPVP